MKNRRRTDKQPRERRSDKQPEREQVLAGTLSSFHVAQLLRLLQSARATGCLELVHARERAELFVDDGRSLFARTTGSVPRVGDVLVHLGEVRPEAIEFVLAVQRDQPGVRLGQMLIDGGALTEKQIREAVLVVQRHILLRVLLWREGTFRFLPGERVQGEDIRLELDMDRLLADVLSVAVESHERREDLEAA
jgi:hypothetical protein